MLLPLDMQNDSRVVHFFHSFRLCPQYLTFRQWVPLYHFVREFGEAAVSAVRNYEEKQKVAPNIWTFQKMCAVHDPAMLSEALEVMAGEKPTSGQLWGAINWASRSQWYQWHVMNPALPIHSERRMPLPMHN